MAAPLTVKRNNYHKNPKRSDIQTPIWTAERIFGLFEDWSNARIKEQSIIRILDPCIGEGNLITPWSDSYQDRILVEDYEIKEGTDFLKVESLKRTPDIVLCNPPFNQSGTKEFMPMVFLQKILKLIDYNTEVPIVLFTPHGFRLNLRCRLKGKKGLKGSTRSKRVNQMMDLEERGIKITSIGSMPLDAFGEVLFHTEILIWNAPFLPPHFLCYPS